MFAEVAVPVYIRQTFTYRLLGDMAHRAQVGCRVVVPFNKKLLTGFIVALHENLQGELPDSHILDVEELFDETPIIEREMLELTRWMSDYYYAPWGECIRAALPSGAAIATEQMLTITAAGRAELAHHSGGFAWSSTKHQALELLYHSGTINAKELERHLPKAQTASLIRNLKHAGFISVSQHATDSRLKPKLQNAVRLGSRWSVVGGQLIEQTNSNGTSTNGVPKTVAEIEQEPDGSKRTKSKTKLTTDHPPPISSSASSIFCPKRMRQSL